MVSLRKAVLRNARCAHNRFDLRFPANNCGSAFQAVFLFLL